MSAKVTPEQREWLQYALNRERFLHNGIGLGPAWIPQPIGKQLERKGLVVEGNSIGTKAARRFYTLTEAARTYLTTPSSGSGT